MTIISEYNLNVEERKVFHLGFCQNCFSYSGKSIPPHKFLQQFIHTLKHCQRLFYESVQCLRQDDHFNVHHSKPLTGSVLTFPYALFYCFLFFSSSIFFNSDFILFLVSLSLSVLIFRYLILGHNSEQEFFFSFFLNTGPKQHQSQWPSFVN